ncbi:MAG TPA: hypothetical protein VH372_24415 [Actinospica sp.]|jgi:hypothetical protein|nr:hypothetical protein [Actinospica sp.]
MNTTMRRAALATAGLAVAGGAAFGTTEAFAASPAATPTTSASASASASAAKAAACKDAKHPARCALRREAARDRGALLRKGAHGQNTVKNSAGAYVVREWQVGKVTAVGGATVTVADGDGTTWTWATQSSTVYRVDGAKGALGGVHVGDTILVRGQQNGSANDAARITDPNQSKLAAELGK